jgi:hypothetical protein
MMMELCGRKYPVKQELSFKAGIVLFNESISRGKNSQTVCADFLAKNFPGLERNDTGPAGLHFTLL